jgi:hypothetical protein
MDAMNALPFFLLASELDLALKASNIPAFLGLCTSSPDFRLSAELDLDAEPLRLPECLSLFFSFFPSVLASLGCLLFPSFALGLATSLLFCLLSALEPHVPDRGRGMDWVSTSSLVMVGRGWEPSSCNGKPGQVRTRWKPTITINYKGKASADAAAHEGMRAPKQTKREEFHLEYALRRHCEQIADGANGRGCCWRF